MILPLEVGDVHVWCVRLDSGELGPAGDVLSHDERSRAARFHFERDARQFSRSHVALRTILARYRDVEPAMLRFAAGPHGKPALDPPSSLRFNLSHSGERALVALAWGREVGVDIEDRRNPKRQHHDATSLLALVRATFSDAEVRALEALESSAVERAFFRCWTRKEALVKATGRGLSFDLRSFDVSVEEGAADALVATRPDAHLLQRFSVRGLDVGEPYEAALAVEQPCTRVRMFRLGDD
jgi:4'-phosphopantetheinyl transferase